jgi:glycosyltransferase involved in cell wall biosynthesis
MNMDMASTSGDRIESICFVAPWAYPVISGDPTLRGVGGSEVQQTILAREFAKRGYKVSMVTFDQGQPDGIVIDGVKIFKSYKHGTALPKLKRLWSFVQQWRAMRRANADLYYQQNCAVETGYIAAFGLLNRRHSVYCGASDDDFKQDLPYLHSRSEKFTFHWGLKHVSRIVAQSARQVDKCRESFGLDSEVIRSAYGHRGASGTKRGPVLWAGNIKPIKRPELFVELARRCPELDFTMVGGGDPVYVEPVRALASGVSNLRMTGFVPYGEVEKYFDGASVIVNTSYTEGFPNTFLQAWSRGTPSLSFFDPAAHVEGREVGIVVPDIDAMEATLRRLKTDDEYWSQHGRDSRSYFAQNFALDKVADQYEQLFGELASRAHRGSPHSRYV